ncbi:hypothetical protein SEA_BAUER_55 [Arthrobacter phage Bauer]|uniref:Uncharacterized protein n=1 Tax=Arthrobacter phage Bauer TaxID=2985648 RepID=A0A9E7V2P2_9CAUD|nr:hypothetical protein QEO99_gp55 [Arthrobacter phage Bauer]UYM26604.1 hypothetical protein SEA_BAUER_55 [Arthrobacter phage Bauer]
MNISNEAVYAAADVFERVVGVRDTRAVEKIIEAAMPHLLTQATALIRDLSDRDECWFDHHGGCQAHGYLSLEAGETCPQADAKAWVAGATGGC